MKIIKGTLLSINHVRKGNFIGVAMRDFNTETDEFFPIAVAQKYVSGVSIEKWWNSGEEIPCRRNLCTVEVIEKVTKK